MSVTTVVSQGHDFLSGHLLGLLSGAWNIALVWEGHQWQCCDPEPSPSSTPGLTSCHWAERGGSPLIVDLSWPVSIVYSESIGGNERGILVHQKWGSEKSGETHSAESHLLGDHHRLTRQHWKGKLHLLLGGIPPIPSGGPAAKHLGRDGLLESRALLMSLGSGSI